VRSKAWVCLRSLDGIAGSNTAVGMDVYCDRCVLSGGGHWGGLIICTEESHRVWCAWVSSWIIDNEEALAHQALLHHWRKIHKFVPKLKPAAGHLTHVAPCIHLGTRWVPQPDQWPYAAQSLIKSQVLSKLSAFYWKRSLLPYSQQPATRLQVFILYLKYT